MKKIIRLKSLIENLMDMELNSSVEIHTKECKGYLCKGCLPSVLPIRRMTAM